MYMYIRKATARTKEDCTIQLFYVQHNSPSSSTIVTVSIQSGCNKTPLGREEESIVKLNDSFASNMLSSIIEILKGTLISPAENVILKDPDP